jgi:hypothetical protein
MIRWIAASAGALAVTLTLGLAMPLGNQAVADGMSAPVYRPVIFRHKRCLAPASWWGRAPVTWVCNIEEKCCYDRLLRRGTCLPADQRCF